MIGKVYALGLVVLLSATCLTSTASAQTSWWRNYGGIGDDGGESVQPTSDGGYVIAGWTWSFGAGDGDFYLVKTNARGDTLWTRTYGGTGYDLGYSVQQTTDGGYVIAGYARSFGAGNGDVYLIKTNGSGDSLWTRTYGGTSEDRARSVQQTADGGYIVAGHTYSFGAGSYDVYLIRTNAQGDTLWTRTYGGTSVDQGYSVQQTADGGYVIAGYTFSYGAGNADVYLVKTDASGDTLWTRTYGGASYDYVRSVQPTTDGGYIIAGNTESYGVGSRDVYLVKTDASGDTLWTRTCGGSSRDDGQSVQPTTDGGLIIAGHTESFGTGGSDVYLIKMNAQGDTLWARTYGDTNDDYGNSVQPTTDGGYIIAGYTESFGADSIDVCLIKTDSLGNVGIEEPLIRHRASPTGFRVQPSPFSSFARVPGHETELFALSDVTGRQVAICRGDRVGEGLRPGVYFLSPAGSKAGKAATETVIKAAF